MAYVRGSRSLFLGRAYDITIVPGFKAIQREEGRVAVFEAMSNLDHTGECHLLLRIG